MDNKAYAAGLRALADFYENNQSIINSEQIYVFTQERDDFLAMVKAMAKGGRVEKKVGLSDDPYADYVATRMFGELKLRVSIPRKQICKLISPAVYDCPDSLLREEFESRADEPELTEQETAQDLAATAKESIESQQ